MRKRVDAAVIGGFVLGAITLLVAGVVLWGSGRLFRQTAKYVCYFDGSIEGLEVGAPVKVRGVGVGKVVRIQLRYRQRPTDDRIPVFIEVDLNRIAGLGAERPNPHQIDEFIARGMRARLENQSWLTGILFVNIGQYPDSPLKFSEVDPAGGYPEIPTVPRPLAEMSEAVRNMVVNLGNVDFAGMVQSFTDAASSIERTASAARLKETMEEVSTTLKSFEKLSRSLEAEAQPLLAEVKLAVADARKALVGLDGAAGAASKLVAPEAPLAVRTSEALVEITRAAAALRELADYLQRNPNSVFVGKGR